MSKLKHMMRRKHDICKDCNWFKKKNGKYLCRMGGYDLLVHDGFNTISQYENNEIPETCPYELEQTMANLNTPKRNFEICRNCSELHEVYSRNSLYRHYECRLIDRWADDFGDCYSERDFELQNASEDCPYYSELMVLWMNK